MRSRRSTIVTLTAVGAGLMVILAAGMVLQGPAWERWYISRLTSRDAAARQEAADRLAAIGSVKAIPHLMQAFSLTVRSVEAEEAGTGPFAQMKSMYGAKASRTALVASLAPTSRTSAGRTIVRPSRTASRRRVQLTNLRNQSVALDFGIDKLASEVLDDASSRALMKIAKDSSAASLPRLLGELERGDWEIRWLAVHVLGELDAEEATAAIRSAARDENEHVREAARIALERREGGRDASPGAFQIPTRTRRGF
jgi:hypothetical protein